MEYKRILTVQDVSCVGQCSLTVALPIISACGVETAVLPSAVLSTHTAGFKGFTFRDLSQDMPSILNHWVSEGIKFDAIYTGYLGSKEQIETVLDIAKRTLKDGASLIVDPAMADNGKLYPAFDMNYVGEMRRLVGECDVVVPNITEACLLTGVEYREEYDKEYIVEIAEKLILLGAKRVVLTGVSYSEGKTGVVVFDKTDYFYYEHEKLSNSCHGTGDIYASALVGAFVRGKSLSEASVISADYTVECIRYTKDVKDHWYGACFEPVLDKLINAINK